MKNVPEDELLSAYLDGEATPQERAAVEKLLASDPAARPLLDELRAVSQSVQNLPAVHLGEDLGDRVLQLAERQMLLERPDTAPADVRPMPGSVARSIARRFLQPRLVVRTALILLVAAGLYLFEVRPANKLARQVAVGVPAARPAAPAKAPQLHALSVEKRSDAAADLSSSVVASQLVKPPMVAAAKNAERLRKDMPKAEIFDGASAPAESAVPAVAAPVPPMPSIVKNDESRTVARDSSENRTPGAAARVASQPEKDADREATPANRPRLPYGQPVISGFGQEKAADLSGRVVAKDYFAHKTGAAASTAEPPDMPSVPPPGLADGRPPPDQDVLVVKLIASPQALEQQTLERLLDRQQIVATMAKVGPSQSQYVGEAAPEKLATLVQELRSRKVDFPSVVAGSQAANSVYSVVLGGVVDNRFAADSIRLEPKQLDALKQQLQSAQPVIEQQQQASQQLTPLAGAAKAVLDNHHMRFLFQVSKAESPSSSPAAVGGTPSKPAARSNPLRRDSAPNAGGDRPQ